MQKAFFLLIFLFLFVGVSPASQSNATWMTVHELINEANAVDRRLLDEAAGKGMGDAAKAKSGRAWKKVKDYLESLSLSELVETASASAESVSSRSELKEEWECEAAAASNVELILSVYKSKNPRQADIDGLVSKTADQTQPVYFRIALFSWLRNQLMSKYVKAVSTEQTQKKFLQKSYAVLVDEQNPESVRLAAMNAYRDVVVQDIVTTCHGSEVLRPHMKTSDVRNHLVELVCSGEINVPHEVKKRFLERNKDILQLLNVIEKECQKESNSLRFKRAVVLSLHQLNNTPLDTLQREKVTHLQSQLVQSVKPK